jgi:hypothetical protein
MDFDQREVLLVNGGARNLFERYIGDVKQKDIRLDFQSLRIYVVDRDGSIKNVPLGAMTFEEILSATTFREKWRKMLSGIQSFDRVDAEALSNSKNWDVVCGSGVRPVAGETR